MCIACGSGKKKNKEKDKIGLLRINESDMKEKQSVKETKHIFLLFLCESKCFTNLISLPKILYLAKSLTCKKLIKYKKFNCKCNYNLEEIL